MQTADDDLLSAFRYGSVLRSTIQAANIFRATSGIMTFPGMEGAFPKDNKLDYDDKQQVSPFDPEAIVPLPFQLQEIKNRSLGSAVWRRNERERYRVRCVNEAYDTLRDHLPYGEEDKRLSKVETLRLAILYIRHLEMLLADGGHEERCLCFDDFQKTFASQ